jgi:protein-S-isoprenylcysteine O-methyltransferase Ste14
MNIAAVQTIRKIVLAIGIAVGIFVFAVTDSRHVTGSTAHELIEWVGFVLIVVCILGRTWSSLYIGGRKIEELVQTGPYSVMRNPLYFFSILGAAGVGAQSGSALIALICGVIALIVFRVVVGQEEKVLLERYGDIYRAFMTRVPRFFPKPSLWADDATLTIRPPRVVMTFADALVFLLAIPIAEGFEYLQDIGVLPVLLTLP